MNNSEQELRNLIAFQFGQLSAKLLNHEDFELSVFIDPIVVAAKKLTLDDSESSSTP